MRKYFVLLLVITSAFIFISAQAASSLAGQWVNVNSKTRGIDKIIIKQNAHGNLLINGFGKCEPTDCVWGNVALKTFIAFPKDKNKMYGLAVWKSHNARWPGHAFIDETMVIEKINTDKIHVMNFTVFKDHSGRANYVDSAILKRAKQGNKSAPPKF